MKTKSSVSSTIAFKAGDLIILNDNRTLYTLGFKPKFIRRDTPCLCLGYVKKFACFVVFINSEILYLYASSLDTRICTIDDCL